VSASGPTAPQPLGPSGWERFSRATASGFQRYAQWLVSITWKKFLLLSVLLLIGSGILAEIPPFSFKFTISADDAGTKPSKKESKEKAAKLKALKEKYGDVDIKVDETGIHVTRKRVTKTPESKSEPAAGASRTSSGSIEPGRADPFRRTWTGRSRGQDSAGDCRRGACRDRRGSRRNP